MPSDEVGGGAGRLGEVDVACGDAAVPDLVQHGLLERLDDEPVAGCPPGDLRGEQLVERQSDGREVARMLDLRHELELPPGTLGLSIHDVQQVAQPQHRRDAVEARGVLTHRRDAFDRAKRGELGPREVLGEPAGEGHRVDDLGGATIGELGADRCRIATHVQ